MLVRLAPFSQRSKTPCFSSAAGYGDRIVKARQGSLKSACLHQLPWPKKRFCPTALATTVMTEKKAWILLHSTWHGIVVLLVAQQGEALRERVICCYSSQTKMPCCCCVILTENGDDFAVMVQSMAMWDMVVVNMYFGQCLSQLARLYFCGFMLLNGASKWQQMVV